MLLSAGKAMNEHPRIRRIVYKAPSNGLDQITASEVFVNYLKKWNYVEVKDQSIN